MSVACSTPAAAAHRLRDGTDLCLRELEPGDRDTVLEVFAGLGPRSRELRFLTPKPRLTGPDLRALSAVDDRDHVAVVAEVPAEGAVGIARFVRTPEDPDVAEAAIAVVDAWQRRGVGTALAAALMERARSAGLRRFHAVILRDNKPALHLLHSALVDVERLALDRESAEFSLSLDEPRPGSRRPVRRTATLKGVRR
jgi:GNAT superfamily N-acetyltransferase